MENIPFPIHQISVAPEIGAAAEGSSIFLFRRKAWLKYSAAFLALLMLLAFYRRKSEAGPIGEFWGQLADAKGQMVLALGDFKEQRPTGVAVSDINTMEQLKNTAGVQDRSYNVVDASSADLLQFKTDPILLVAPYHNQWSRSLTASMRFSFMQDDDSKLVWIQDSQFPSRRAWVTHNLSTGIQNADSYAIIARFVDPNLHSPMVLVTGLTPEGTLAAGTVLTNPTYLNSLLRDAPRDWQTENLEAVIGTEVIDHRPGPPRIEAVYFWK